MPLAPWKSLAALPVGLLVPERARAERRHLFGAPVAAVRRRFLPARRRSRPRPALLRAPGRAPCARTWPAAICALRSALPITIAGSPAALASPSCPASQARCSAPTSPLSSSTIARTPPSSESEVGRGARFARAAGPVGAEEGPQLAREHRLGAFAFRSRVEVLGGSATYRWLPPARIEAVRSSSCANGSGSVRSIPLTFAFGDRRSGVEERPHARAAGERQRRAQPHLRPGACARAPGAGVGAFGVAADRERHVPRFAHPGVGGHFERHRFRSLSPTGVTPSAG